MERTQTDPADVALRRLLTEPSYGAQVLKFTARLLQLDPTVDMDGCALRRAQNIATEAVLRDLPEVVRRDSLERAQRALPDLTGITRGEAALRLYAAAKALG